jgi:cytochrome c-type biogenesis protein CcmH
MTQLWIGIAGLIVIAIAFLLLPVLMNQRDLSFQRRTQNTRIYKERLAELDVEAEVAGWTEQELVELKDELAQSLLQDVDDKKEEEGSSTSKKWAIPLTLILIIGVSGITVGLYESWGASKDLAIQQLLAQGRQPHGDSADTYKMQQDLEALLESKVSGTPEDLDSIFMLARLQMNQDKYSKAANSFAMMFKALPIESHQDRSMALASQAQALFFANNRTFDQNIEVMLNDALSLNPQERTALGLKGISEFNKGEYRNAIIHWQHVIAMLEPGANAQAIQGGIDAAMRHLKEAGEDTTGLIPEAPEQVGLNIDVSIDDTLKNTLPADTRVFVLARAVGERMPVAVQTLQLQDLPTKIMLNDSMAMSPAAKLSMFDEVEVLVRVSKTGQATPTSGDLKGLIGPINVADAQNTQLKLVINEIVK